MHVVDLEKLRELASSSGAGLSAEQVLQAKVELVGPAPASTSADEPETEDYLVDKLLAGSEEAIKGRLVTEVAWVGDEDLLVRESNRVSDRGRVLHFRLGGETISKGAEEKRLAGNVVRRTSTVKEGGWIEVVRSFKLWRTSLECADSDLQNRHKRSRELVPTRHT